MKPLEQARKSVSGSPVRNTMLSRRNALAALVLAATGAVILPIVKLLRPSTSTVPSDTSSLMERGLGLHREQKYDQAVREFTRVIRTYPKLPEAYLFRGIALANAGRHTEAISDFTRALDLSPENAVAYLYRGESNLALGFKDKAAIDFRRALELAGEDKRIAAAARNKLQVVERQK